MTSWGGIQHFHFLNCQFFLSHMNFQKKKKNNCQYFIPKGWLVTPRAKSLGHNCTLFGKQILSVYLVVLLPRMTCAINVHWYTAGCSIVTCSSESQVKRTEWRVMKNTKKSSSLNIPLQRSTVKWFFGTRLSSKP